MITLRNGPISLDVAEDNPLYPYLAMLSGTTLEVSDSNEPVSTPQPVTESTKSKKGKFYTEEPPIEDLIEDMAASSADVVKSLAPNRHLAYETTSCQVDVPPIFKELHTTFINESAIKTLLLRHVEKVLGNESQVTTTVCVPLIEELSDVDYAMLFKAGNYLMVRKNVGVRPGC